jgi:hypothetical protein
MSWNYHWRTSPAVSVLGQTIDQLRTENIRLRRQLSGKDQYIDRLKFLVQQRSNTIDDQRGKLERRSRSPRHARADVIKAARRKPDADGTRCSRPSQTRARMANREFPAKVQHLRQMVRQTGRESLQPRLPGETRGTSQATESKAVMTRRPLGAFLISGH